MPKWKLLDQTEQLLAISLALKEVRKVYAGTIDGLMVQLHAAELHAFRDPRRW